MRPTHTSVISAWFIVFGLFAVSGSGTLAASILLLVVGGFGALAIIRPTGWRTSHATEPATRPDRALPGSADEYDLMRMDSDQG